jgi:hypothetical protein
MRKTSAYYVYFFPFSSATSILVAECRTLSQARWLAKKIAVGFYEVLDRDGLLVEAFRVVNRWESVPHYPRGPRPEPLVAVLFD